MNAVAWATVAALVAGVSLQPVVVRLMRSAGVLDVPSERSSHRTATPRGGGIAVVVAAALGTVLLPSSGFLLVPLLAFAAIGLAEDLYGVGVTGRLATQTVAAVATAITLAPRGPAAVLIVVTAWLVAYVNAFNFMDGVNGISALNGVLAGGVYAVLGASFDVPALLGAGAVTAAAALSFLPWNAGTARIFLGDVGSYGLGAVVGTLAAYAAVRGVPIEAALAPVALYVADTGWTLLARVRRGEAWHRPHRTHVYQRLTDVGGSHGRVAVTTALCGLAVSACALAGSGHGWPVRLAWDAAAIAILAGYVAAPAWLAARRGDHDRGRVYV
jgi:UDP-N-acetylmuramyl pentapeptide phosphotransferase/UDP-N-acetylglucosamine-1-phosphate transferase